MTFQASDRERIASAPHQSKAGGTSLPQAGGKGPGGKTRPRGPGARPPLDFSPQPSSWVWERFFSEESPQWLTLTPGRMVTGEGISKISYEDGALCVEELDPAAVRR